MDYTDRHMRFLLRLLSRRMVLWTEMISSASVVHTETDKLARYLNYNEHCEHPVVLQLGGSDPAQLREACKLVRPYKYDAINLNCGCPSNKVAGQGCFGAALMREPALVSDICLNMREGSGGDVPITVKCRIGVDNDDSYEQLHTFVEAVSSKGEVPHFIIHARKAILNGLSPDQNRKIPPLRYDYVYRLVEDFPHLDFTLNGGILTYEQVDEALSGGAHGVMVGRDICNRPWYWRQVDSKIYGQTDPGLSRSMVLGQYCAYAEEVEAEAGERWLPARRRLLKPIWNLFHGEPGGKKFRVALERLVPQPVSFSHIIEESCASALTAELLHS